MKLYLTGLITGILLTVSATMFLGARTVNVKKKNLGHIVVKSVTLQDDCLLYTSPSPRDLSTSRMPSSA